MKKTGIVGKMFTDWRPYHDSCNFCQVQYTVISKTETFQEDKSRILRMVGQGKGEGEGEEERIHVHAGSMIQNVTKKHFENVSNEVKSKLIEVFKYEFEMFNYDSEMY